MTFNWDAISAAAEVIGVVAVLASILYLARQVAQGNRLNHSDSIRNFLAQYNTFLAQIGDKEMVEIWRKGTHDFNSLTEHEKSRLHTIFLSHYMLGQAQRLIDPDGNEELSKFADYFVAVTVSQAGVRTWWDTFKGALPDQEYVARIDAYPKVSIPKWEKFLPWFTPDVK
ncbi:MAG: hypothetical protein ACU84Q_01485 [Gammaproteobacteria bacterium]